MIHLKISVIINTNWYIVVVNLKGRDGFEDVEDKESGEDRYVGVLQSPLSNVILLNYCWYLDSTKYIVPCPASFKSFKIFTAMMETDKLPYKSRRTREGHSRWVDLQCRDKDDDGQGLVCWSPESDQWSISSWRLLFQTKQTELKQSQIWARDK